MPDAKSPRVLAIVPNGPDRTVIEELSGEAGWLLTVDDAPAFTNWWRDEAVPPVVLFDRSLAGSRWQKAIGSLAGSTCHPYVILLSPTSDSNLWEELQRLGGADVVRTPLNRQILLQAVNRGWQFWRSQQQVRQC